MKSASFDWLIESVPFWKPILVWVYSQNNEKHTKLVWNTSTVNNTFRQTIIPGLFVCPWTSQLTSLDDPDIKWFRITRQMLMGVEKILSPWNIQISWSEWSFIRTVLLIIHSDHPSSIHRYYKPILFIIVRFGQKP